MPSKRTTRTLPFANKTLAAIEAQIARLQQQAQALRAAEVAEVVARIRQAMAHYGITADELGSGGKGAGRRVPARKQPQPTALKAGQPRYGDGQGKTWTGRGKRPKWFVDALAAGKTAQDMLLKAGKGG